MPGTNTLTAEVTHISKHGFRLLLGDEELLLPFSEFPWFRQATVEQLCNVEWPTPDHLYWPQLDVDLSVESIRHPERFPLVSTVSANPALQGDTPQPARLSASTLGMNSISLTQKVSFMAGNVSLPLQPSY